MYLHLSPCAVESCPTPGDISGSIVPQGAPGSSHLVMFIVGTFYGFLLLHPSMCEAYCRWGGGVDWVESTTGYTLTPCVGSFTYSGIEGPTVFSVSSERHRDTQSLM